jgi:exodeoxyribonuclease VIII
MNNYPYLIKAKAKATDSKSLFCWFSAKSDSRAERKILDILKTLKLTLVAAPTISCRSAPTGSSLMITEEGVLDDTWCDRYELGGEDGLTWQKMSC